MNRYIARPKGVAITDEYGDVAWTADLVFQPDDAPVRTGLLDQHGNDLYRCLDRDPIGYRRR